MTTLKWILVNQGLLAVMAAFVTAQWSSWVHVKTDICQPVCRQALVYRRSCSNPGGTPCPGTDNKLLTQDCDGDLCTRVDGRWTAWLRHDVGKCLLSCTRSVTLKRSCSDPSPGRIGVPCPGSDRVAITEGCKGGKCLTVDGQWASWERYHVLPCQSNCRRGVSLRRTCTNPGPAYGGEACPGDDHILVSEECDDFLCNHAESHWTEWFRRYTGPCMLSCVRVVSWTRSCRVRKHSELGCSGTNKTEGTEECEGDKCTRVNGKWSTWFRFFSAPCEANCKRGVAYRRTCTKPRPAGGGKKCAGMENKHTTEECRGYLCKRKTVSGQWTFWARTGVGVCPSTCRRTVTLTRRCTDPTLTSIWLRCDGRDTLQVTELCRGSHCVRNPNEVLVFWAPWTIQHTGQCLEYCKRKLTLGRTCLTRKHSREHAQCFGPTFKVVKQDCVGGTCPVAWQRPRLMLQSTRKGQPAIGVKNPPSTVDGQWSSWSTLRTEFDSCPPGCHQVVYLTRTCSRPTPRGNGRQCRGGNTRARTENCCPLPLASAATQKCIGNICRLSQYEINLIAISAVTGMTLVIFIGVVYVSHRACSHRSALHHC